MNFQKSYFLIIKISNNSVQIDKINWQNLAMLTDTFLKMLKIVKTCENPYVEGFVGP